MANREKITQYKNILEKELSELVKELQSIATQTPDTKDWVAVPITEDSRSADNNLEADGVEEWNERRALVGQLETRYRNILLALKKIEEGKYGVCEISGNEIEEVRLNANPAARTNLANIEREKELSL
jgi:RNA polymerase-binding transcription factor DksA